MFKRFAAFIGAALLMVQTASTQSNLGLVQPSSIADITGTGATVQLYSTGGPARDVLIFALAANTGTARCGDSNAGTSRGVPLAAGASRFYPPQTQISGDLKQPLYNLASFYCYIANGDKVSVTWEN